MNVYYVYMTPAGDIMGIRRVYDMKNEDINSWTINMSIQQLGAFKVNAYEVYINMDHPMNFITDAENKYFNDLKETIIQLVRDNKIDIIIE